MRPLLSSKLEPAQMLANRLAEIENRISVNPYNLIQGVGGIHYSLHPEIKGSFGILNSQSGFNFNFFDLMNQHIEHEQSIDIKN